MSCFRDIIRKWMNTPNDAYLQSVIARHTPYFPAVQGINMLQNTWNALVPIAQQWAGLYLSELILSGSIAKGTNITGSSDLDMFISLKSSTPHNLSQIHNSLMSFLQQKGLNPRKQNVSIGFNYNGLSIDMTPGKRQASNSNYHSLYSHKRKTWTQTNIQMHINAVKNSKRISEIKLAKIWKTQNNLVFSSHYIELAVMEALRGHSYTNLSANFEAVLAYFSQKITTARFIDPANSSNVISDDLTALEKLLVSSKAQSTLSSKFLSLGNWNSVIW